ncbi:hypothetical protein EYC80_007676 [Monilinia laxa]|uniref:Uncharacterized protein n=1 Tax=Monilinia laxa TaxID=61186 RepID=A0A5N6JWN2_MONLA|nr:hypothetical protein EYC80_007676 [Monilinia laxa]
MYGYLLTEGSAMAIYSVIEKLPYCEIGEAIHIRYAVSHHLPSLPTPTTELPSPHFSPYISPLKYHTPFTSPAISQTIHIA